MRVYILSREMETWPITYETLGVFESKEKAEIELAVWQTHNRFYSYSIDDWLVQ